MTVTISSIENAPSMVNMDPVEKRVLLENIGNIKIKQY